MADREPRVLILGAGGMLGSAVKDALAAANIRYSLAVHGAVSVTDAAQVSMALSVVEPTWVINCAGVLKGNYFGNESIIGVNAYAPHVLARMCETHSARLLHVSTDCVLPVLQHLEPMPHSASAPIGDPPSDLYGATKLMGEPRKAVVVRTSFVGKKHGLLKWFLDQPEDATINGWDYAYWSGSTVEAVAKGLVQFVTRNNDPNGIYHLATEKPISKTEVLRLFRDRFGRPDITINPAPYGYDRSLLYTYWLPSLAEALKQ